MGKRLYLLLVLGISFHTLFVWVHTFLVRAVLMVEHQTTKVADMALHEVSTRPRRNVSYQTSDEPIPNPNGTQQCGIFVFYHVGKCGGTSVMEWQKDLANASQGQIRYLDMYETYKRGLDRSPKWTFAVSEIESEIATLGKRKKWLSVRQHHRSPGLRYMMTVYQRWERALELQGCRLILTTTLRDPLSRVKSLLSYNKIPRHEFEEYVLLSGEGQASYLLFNTCEPRNDVLAPTWCNGPGAMKNKRLAQQTLDELVGYLKEFDYVGQTEKLDHFIDWSETQTGWRRLGQSKSRRGNKAPNVNLSYSRYNFTNRMEDRIRQAFESDQILWNLMFERS